LISSLGCSDLTPSGVNLSCVAQYGAILGGMNRQDLTEDDRDEVIVLQLLELLQQFGDPLQRPAKVIPWPKPQAGQGQ
jgi:hypothetical protein